MFALLFDLGDYATIYRATRDAYLKAANELKLATGSYKAAVTPMSPALPPTPSLSTSKSSKISSSIRILYSYQVASAYPHGIAIGLLATTNKTSTKARCSQLI